MFTEFTRRDFFKKTGVLATSLALSGCGGRRTEERLVPFLQMPEEQVAGVFTDYASACGECPAGCGVLVRVMGGRAHKIEGNPRHPINQGRLCARGQAALQGLYNPDRIKGPQARSGGRDAAWGSISWDDAIKRLSEAVQSAGVGAVAVYAGQLPDHLYKLAGMFLGGAPTGVDQGWETTPIVWNLARAWEAHNLLLSPMSEVFGQPGDGGAAALPIFDISAADVVLSFGANFLEAWQSPVLYARQFGEIRRRDVGRGYVVQIEGRLSTTGACADLWLPIPPGREGELDLALGRIILDEHLESPDRQSGIEAVFEGAQPRAYAQDLGLSLDSLVRLARIYARAAAPLAIPGGALAGNTNGVGAVQAVLALNLLVGAQGRTLRLGPGLGDPALGPLETVSSFGQVRRLVEDMRAGRVKALLVLDGDPLHDLPGALDFKGAAAQVPLVADFSPFPTDTHQVADLLMPGPTPLETWGYRVPQPGTSLPVVTAQQPIIRQMHDTRSSADVLLAVAQAIGGDAGQQLKWDNEVAYLKETVGVLAGKAAGSITAPDPQTFWNRWQQFGGWWATTTPTAAPPAVRAPAVRDLRADLQTEGDIRARPYLLHPYITLLYGEGRGANKPWLLEASDPMTSVMWETWVEINPQEAERLSIETGDAVRVGSSAGSIDTVAYVYPGIGPDVVAMPLGLGHTAYGRYAGGLGANAAALLTLTPTAGLEAGAEELAFGATRVSVEKIGGKRRLPRLEGSDSTVVPEGL